MKMVENKEEEKTKIIRKMNIFLPLSGSVLVKVLQDLHLPSKSRKIPDQSQKGCKP